MDSGDRGVVKTVRARSNSLLRAIMVVISETVMRLTSSPSMATMRSPGEIVSAKTLLVRTPETTVPRESALLARMIPNFPGGAMTVMRLRRAVPPLPLLNRLLLLLPLRLRRLERLFRGCGSSPPPPEGLTMASCISSRNKSLATERLCSGICEMYEREDRCE